MVGLGGRARVCVVGGKGGVGKTLVACGLALWFAGRGVSVVLVDVDVGCPNSYLLLGARLSGGVPVRVFRPVIDVEKCRGCGRCCRACPNGALVCGGGGAPVFVEGLCSGCQACLYACLVGAVGVGWRVVGFVHEGSARGVRLVVGRLLVGFEHAVHVVVAARRFAERVPGRVEVVDAGAGAGSLLAHSIRGCDLVVVVVDDSPAGVADAERVLMVASRLGLRCMIVASMVEGGSPRFVGGLASRWGVPVVGSIPFDEGVVEAYRRGVHPMVSGEPASVVEALETVAERVAGVLGVGG